MVQDQQQNCLSWWTARISQPVIVSSKYNPFPDGIVFTLYFLMENKAIIQHLDYRKGTL